MMPVGWRQFYSWRWTGGQRGTTTQSEEGLMDGEANFTQTGKN